ncbi:MAG TPA: IPT/TIG domain-containing protein [Candidatus Angelobacter sp.]|nr:IPT/TIG domain-containing protein [Candidatus Angelobacter sp.]
MRSKVFVLAVLFILGVAGSTAALAQNYNLTVAVLVNSSNTTGYNTSTSTPGEYQRYAERYFENFQIPYQVFDVSTALPPSDLNNRQLIIAAHRGLSLSSTWQNAIVSAVQGGTGFVNLDSDSAIGNNPHIRTIFGATGSALGSASTSITIPAALAPGGATPHYIAGLQWKSPLEFSGDFVYSFHVDQNGNQQTATATVLQNAVGTVIAKLGTDPLVLATTFGAGRAVNFGTLDYLQADRFGFLMGVDDIFWRSLVWAARKPFALRGYPRFWALRMDHNVDTGWPTRVKEMYDPTLTGNVASDGTGGPWKVSGSVYLNFLPPGDPGRASIIQDVKAGKIQLSPHGFESVTFGDLFWGGTNSPPSALTDSQWLSNVSAIQQWVQGNGGNDTIPTMSKWVLGHFYDISNNTGWDFWNTFGFRYLGTTDLPGFTYTTDTTQAGYFTERLKVHPYWIYQLPPKPANEFASDESFPFFFADDITVGSRAGLPAQKMFLIGSRAIDHGLAGIDPDIGWCNGTGDGAGFSEGKYEWYTWRLFTSMVPVEIFTHDDAYSNCQDATRKQIIQTVSSWLNQQKARQVFMQDMAQYVYARTKSTLTQASFNGTNITYTFTGKAADADGNLVPTQVLVFSGDNEGVWQNVPGFTSGLTTSLAAPPAPPTVVAVNPNGGPLAGGTTVSISGSSFTSGSTVTIGGAAATNVVVVNSSTISAVVPAGAQGSVDVTVTTPNGSGTLKGGYTYLAPPTITRISPTSGPSSGGNIINIHGTSLTADTQVTIGGLAATGVTLIDSTRLAATVPANSIGTVAGVTVTNSLGTATLANAYTYLDPTTILLQDSFNGDSTATWTASPLGLASNWTRVNGAFDYNGGGATQQYSGASNWNNYTFEAKVRLFSLQNFPGGIRGRINSSTGVAYAVWLYPGTNAIKLFRTAGWNIDTSGLVTLASASLTYDATNFHTIRLTFQGTSIQVFWDGTLVLSATDGSNLSGVVGFDVSNQHIQFEDALVTGTISTGPIVTSLTLTPSTIALNSAGATQQLTLTANMSDGTSQNVTSNSGTTYSSNNTGAATVNSTGLVTAVANGSATITAAYSGLTATSAATVNISAPSVTRISPIHGSTAGGDQMDIYGSTLSVNSTVTIQGHNAPVLSALSDGSRITVTVPAGTAGSADVSVSNPATAATTLTGAYSYVSPSSILFQDSFNTASLSNWTISPLGLLSNWTAAQDVADYNGGGHTQLFAGSSSWTDYTVEGRFNLFSTSNYPGGLRGRVNTGSGAGYEAWILPGSRTIVLYRTTGWSIDTPGLTSLGSAAVTNMDPNVFHSLKLSFSGTTISVIYDGATIIQATDATLTSGAVALDVSNQHIQFDDVFVSQP